MFSSVFVSVFIVTDVVDDPKLFFLIFRRYEIEFFADASLLKTSRRSSGVSRSIINLVDSNTFVFASASIEASRCP